MGTAYKAVCKTCKAYRDLDKFHAMPKLVENRQGALYASTDIKDYSFHAALLVSFLWKHKGHDCTVCDESDLGDLYTGMQVEDINFWI